MFPPLSSLLLLLLLLLLLYNHRPHHHHHHHHDPGKNSRASHPSKSPRGVFGGAAASKQEAPPKKELLPRLVTVIDPTNPFNNVGRSVSSYKYARMIQKQFNSAAMGMRTAAMRYETDKALSTSTLISSVLFLNTMNRYRFRGGGRHWSATHSNRSSGSSSGKLPGESDEGVEKKLRRSSTKTVRAGGGQPSPLQTANSDPDLFTETELSNLSDASGWVAAPYSADISAMEERLAHARQFEAPSIGDEQLVALVMVLLDINGAVPIGKMGSMLHNATNNHSLPAMIKSKYGGLKRFLLSHSDLFRVGVEHPFNPPVTLLQPPSAIQRHLVQEIIKTSGGSLATGGGSASKTQSSKPAGGGTRRDRNNNNNNNSNNSNTGRKNGGGSSSSNTHSAANNSGSSYGGKRGHHHHHHHHHNHHRAHSPSASTSSTSNRYARGGGGGGTAAAAGAPTSSSSSSTSRHNHHHHYTNSSGSTMGKMQHKQQQQQQQQHHSSRRQYQTRPQSHSMQQHNRGGGGVSVWGNVPAGIADSSKNPGASSYKSRRMNTFVQKQ
eukprot:jgi/Bigna1/79057/fgenesh1_pg.59_\